MSQVNAWMPLYIGDYLADTMHLKYEAHGPYLLLIMHYWRCGPLTDDDASLAAITRVPEKVWNGKIGPIIRAFFMAKDGKLHHKRIDLELAKAMQNSSKRRDAANARWMQNRSTSNANALHTESKRNDHARALQSQSPKKDTLASLVTTAEPPSDPKAILWRDGLAAIKRMTSKPDGVARRFLGKLIDIANGDVERLNELIAKAEIEQPSNPEPWLIAGAKATNGHDLLSATPDDPWGIRAWISKQPDVHPGTSATNGRTVDCINRYPVEEMAADIATAIKLPETHRVNWDALGGWLREDVLTTDEPIQAMGRQAARMRSNGDVIRSMAVFDQTARMATSR